MFNGIAGFDEQVHMGEGETLLQQLWPVASVGRSRRIQHSHDTSTKNMGSAPSAWQKYVL